jgi:nicotinamidase-related amidase
MASKTYPIGKTAIVIVDPYNDFMSHWGKLWPLLRKVSLKYNVRENLKKIVTAGRENGVLIAYAPHLHYVPGQFSERKYLHPSHVGIKTARVFEKGKFGSRFYDSLLPLQGDLISSCHSCSSGFADTDLHEQLTQNDITHIVIVGYTSNTCVEATARSAVDLDYHVTLVTDAVSSWTPEDHYAAVGVNYNELAGVVTSTGNIIKDIQSLGKDHV